MKRFIFVLSVLASIVLNAQSYNMNLAIANGNEQENFAPFACNKKYSVSQCIYLKEEINMSCQIQSLAWSYYTTSASSTPITRNLRIYMGETDMDEFSGSNTLLPEDSLQLVWQGQRTVYNQPFSFYLDTPFDYSATKNLVIVVVDNSNIVNLPINFNGTYCSSNRCMHFGSEEQVEVDDYNMEASNFLPRVQIGFTFEMGDCFPMLGLAPTESFEDRITVGWANSFSQNYILQLKQEDDSWDNCQTFGSTNSSLTFNNLQPNTRYNIRGRTECDSNWLEVLAWTTCPPIDLPWSEDFEDIPSGVPECWLKHDMSNYRILPMDSVYVDEYSGESMLELSKQSRVFTLPVFNWNLSNIVISFQAKVDNTQIPSEISICLSNPRGGGGFVLEYISSQDIANANGMVNFGPFSTLDYQLSSGYYNGLDRIAFKYSGNEDVHWYIDNIVIDKAIPCDRPLQPFVIDSSVTYNAAEVVWDTTANSMVRIEYCAYGVYGQSSWTIIDSVTQSPYTLTDLQPSTTYIVKVGIECEDTILYSWNSNFHTPQACPLPQWGTHTIESHQATIRWSNVSDEATYTLEVMHPDSTIVVYQDLEECEYTLDDLEMGARYTCKLTVDCHNGYTSAYPITTYFTTLCDTVRDYPYSESFEGLSLENILYYNNYGCWSNNSYIGRWMILDPITNPGYAHTGDNAMYICSYEQSQYYSKGELTTPMFDVSSLDNPYLSFFFKCLELDGQVSTLQVHYRTSTTSPWIPIGPIYNYPTDYYIKEFLKIEVDSLVQFRFKADGTQGGGVLLDDIALEDFYCSQVGGLRAEKVFGHSAIISWLGETTYLEYRKADETEWESIAVTSSPYTIFGLEPLTKYYVRMTANCNYNDAQYSIPIIFETKDNCSSPYIESVDIYPDVVDVTWIGEGNNYTLKIRPTDQYTWTTVSEEGTLYSFYNLLPMTEYTLQIIANCDNGTSGPVTTTFTTMCNDINAFPYQEGFEYNIACWEKDPLEYNDWKTATVTNPYSSKALVLNTNLMGGSVDLISPVINLSSLSTPLLSFYHKQASPDTSWYPYGQDTLGVYYREEEDGQWFYLDSWNTVISDWTLEEYVLPSSTEYFQLKFTGFYNNGSGIMIDNLEIRENPTCFAPEIELIDVG